MNGELVARLFESALERQKYLDLLSSLIMMHGTLTPAQNASRREPDYPVRVPNDHPLFGVGSAYFRQDGAAAPPAGAAAVVAVIPDCIPLGILEGLVCDAVVGPPGNTVLYGTHCFQPDFLGRAVDMAVSGLGEEVSGVGVFIGLFRSLKENNGLVAQPADLAALAPHPAVAPLPAAAFAAFENPDDPASWRGRTPCLWGDGRSHGGGVASFGKLVGVDHSLELL